MKILDIEVTFNEEELEARALITRTDLKGVITYTSRAYRKITKYSKEELLYKPHSIVRHPDMPKFVFKEMWNNLKKDIPWEGYVKNLRKDGKYYWAIVKIIPIYNEYGKKIGYSGIRREPNRKTIEKMEKQLKKWKNN